MKLEQFVQQHKAAVEQELERLLPQPTGAESVLYEAMRYSMFAGGKRLRPCLFLAALAALGKDRQPFLPFACALEMIHTYSLIHDDLPAMDNDDLRRGQPTCHKAFDEAQAILAGDALLTYAFNCMVKVAPYTKAERLLAAIDEVSAAAGLRGMIVGQVVDITKEGQLLTEDQLRFIHEHKTGALFEASLVSAAILVGASNAVIKLLRAYAAKIGLIFQIADDILDVVGEEDKLGKKIGSDAKNHKTTYVTLFGLAEARRMGQDAVQEAQALIAPLGEAACVLAQVPQYFMDRES